MFKKIFIAAIALILIIPPCFANSTATHNKKIIGIFLEAPPTYIKNEDTKKNVQEKVKKLFPPGKFTILPLDTIMFESKTYRENNDIKPSQNLTQKDIQKIASGLNCNYIFLINITTSPHKTEVEFSSYVASVIEVVTCDISFFNVSSGDFLSGVEIISKGKSAKFNTLDSSSFNDIYDKTLDKALKALELDAATL